MRRLRLGSVVVLAVLLASSPAAYSDTPATVALPNTPAGKAFASYLDAVNSGQREAVRKFVEENFEKPPTGPLPVDTIANRHHGIYKSTRGLELKKVVASTDTGITVALAAKRTGFYTQIRMAVSPQPPHKILGMGMSGVEAPADTLPAQPLSDGEIRARVDALVNTLVEADAFSGTILIAKDGVPVYERAVGLASRGLGVPNRIDTKFNVASVGKTFTAVAVAQLVERGKLSFDDTLATALPDYPNKEQAEKVTIHHLLTHTSGLGERKDAAEKSTARRKVVALKEYLPAFAGAASKFEPGPRFDYNNDGYLLLGAVIERASGQSYYDFVRENVYRPAGMTETDCYDLETDPPNLATGYMDAPNGPRRSNAFMLPVRGMPYGLGYSTVKDLDRFALALRGEKLLDAKSLESVWTGKVNRPEPGSQYGYGFHVKRYNGTRVIGHGGGWVGINAHLDIYPDLGYTFAVLTNYDAQTLEVAYKVREWLAQGRR